MVGKGGLSTRDHSTPLLWVRGRPSTALRSLGEGPIQPPLKSVGGCRHLLLPAVFRPFQGVPNVLPGRRNIKQKGGKADFPQEILQRHPCGSVKGRQQLLPPAVPVAVSGHLSSASSQWPSLSLGSPLGSRHRLIPLLTIAAVRIRLHERSDTFHGSG